MVGQTCKLGVIKVYRNNEELKPSKVVKVLLFQSDISLL